MIHSLDLAPLTAEQTSPKAEHPPSIEKSPSMPIIVDAPKEGTPTKRSWRQKYDNLKAAGPQQQGNLKPYLY
jgi:hypothetical protein